MQPLTNTRSVDLLSIFKCTYRLPVDRRGGQSRDEWVFDNKKDANRSLGGDGSAGGDLRGKSCSQTRYFCDVNL